MRAATLVEPPSWHDGSRGRIKQKLNETDYNYFELFSLIICPVSNHTTQIVGGFSKITRSLYVLSSQWRSQGIFPLCLFINYAYICTGTRHNLDETVPKNIITWRGLGKQNMQAGITHNCNNQPSTKREWATRFQITIIRHRESLS